MEIAPVYVIDIRNEFRHLPAFTSYINFCYWLNSNRNPKFVRQPYTQEFTRKDQYRFIFNTQREWEELYRMLSKFRNCTIVVDEADSIFTVNKFQKPLIDVFLGARNNNVSMIFIGKRPSLIPIIVRSQADTFTIFCVEEEYDINYLEKRVKQEFPKDVFKLERGEAIIFKSGEKPIVTQFDKFKGEL